MNQILSLIEDKYDDVKNYIKKEFFEPENIIIQTYRGYGDEEKFRIRGRILELERFHEKPDSAHDAATIVKNFWYMVKRFESDELPGVRISLTVNDNTYQTISDKEGFFYFEICERLSIGWNILEFRVEGDQIGLENEVFNATGEVHIADLSADFAVISDIDDTIMKSYIPKPIKMLTELISKGARNRAAFEGTGKFYQALADCDNKPIRPLFFVSGSPWNIYDVLTEFIFHNDIPRAPLFLKDLGITDDYIFAPETKKHKIKWISELLDFYSNMEFIMIGDSGQEDAEIYHEIVKKYPSRIKTIYIRDVVAGQKSVEFEKLIEEVQNHQSELVIFEKTTEAAKHALEKGYIDYKKKEEVDEIPESVKKTTAV